jgi:hypothetical protein
MYKNEHVELRAGWQWSCGFYPGSEPGEISSDTAATFEEARADFERPGGCFFETNRGRFSVVSQFEFQLPTQTILQPHERSILALQGQVGARDAQ